MPDLSLLHARNRARIEREQAERDRRERIATAALTAVMRTHTLDGAATRAMLAVVQADALIAELDK